MNESIRKVRLDGPPPRHATQASPTVAPTDARAMAPTQPVAKPERATKLRQVAFLALLVGALVYTAQQRRPIGPSAGALDVKILVSRVPADQSAPLRIGTYNIHGGKGTDGRRDLPRIAGVLGGLDFVGLNEVLGSDWFADEDQAATLGRQLKMTSLYTPTEERWFHAKFGNGLLTKLDVTSWQVVPLARTYGKSFRNLLHVRARAANGTPVNIVVTHIDRSDDRERHAQLRTVAEYFVGLQKPAVLLGDMNSDADDPEIERLLKNADVVDVLGKARGFQTPRHIDWIFTRGVEVVDAGLTPAGPSDHPHVWAELTIPAQE
ncbi:MAG: endonuclease/exonuclease/phosphatase family protein [Planctomycetales bacterium]|nr:endonuclease/exonuclease/phosphatase family protein [Planctomycetales bacterium]MBN8623898.1 endonuclease/exonuclease/phosphatase family protein [Planctomycetota bacterium]